ncbi:conserved protein of unknown function [Methanocaldococcus lauensis]|nr:conserved protein of unknown function [Methanocaldococcus lauensis]
MKKIISNRGQITLEFALLLAAIVAAVSIAGFYYLKSISQSSTTAKTTSVKSTIGASNKVLSQVDKVKEVSTNGK